jgi:hypothetical protein
LLAFLQEATGEVVLIERAVNCRHEVSAAHGERGLAKVPTGEVGKVRFGPSGCEGVIKLVKLVGARAGAKEGTEVVVSVGELYGQIVS